MEICKDKSGLFGAVNETGEIVIPFIFDEITIFGDKYYCRIWKDSYWYQSNGACIGQSIHRKEWITERGPDVVRTNKPMLNNNPREYLDSVPMEVEDGVCYKYLKGKFGVLDPDGTVILPCEYDEVWRWPSCEVIETRKGKMHLYFDLSGKPILTKHRLGPVDERLSPYTLSEQQNDISLMTMEFVDSCYDCQCCICYGHPTRLDRVLRQDIEEMMRANSEYRKYTDDAFVRFNGFDNYIYRAYIAHGKGQNPMGDCIRQLHQMRCYQSSWFYIDNVLTNANTELSEAELELLQYAANDCKSGGQTVIGYGIDDSLDDGEVRVFHVEYYAEHEPFDEEWSKVPTFDNLENCLNPLYDEWEETRQILESRTDLSSYGLLSKLAWDMSMASEEKEILFVINAVKWGLEYGWNPNEPFFGKTALEHILDIIDWCGRNSRTSKFKMDSLLEINDLLKEYGGMTLRECRKQNPYYREKDFLIK